MTSIHNHPEFMYCECCEAKVPYVLVDGYSFGDRILDGVRFLVSDNSGTPVVMGVEDHAKDYFNKLNKQRYYNECADYCKELDIASCPVCGEDVPVWDAAY